MVLGHRLVGGEETWSCDPAGNGLTTLSRIPRQHGKGGVGSDQCASSSTNRFGEALLS